MDSRCPFSLLALIFDLFMKLIIKVFPEITVKSRPVRKQFIRQLSKNIRNLLREITPNFSLEGSWDNLELQTPETDENILNAITQRLRETPGIGQFLQVCEYPFEHLDDIAARCFEHYADLLQGKTFAVRCKRIGKHAFSSMDVERAVGSRLMEQGAAGVSLKAPEVEIKLEIRGARLFLIARGYQGLGGYPLGAVDQCLVLMSGGFDSTVAAFQMMRRGLLSHFVFFNLGGRAHELGVMEVAHYLWNRYGRSHRVLFVSVPFEQVLGEILSKVDDRHMGVVLKRMMLRAASQIAERLRIDGLVTGEAVSQVSSQTLANLAAIDTATEKLVLRPLIAQHKQDIIDTAERIGTAQFARHMPEYCGVISVNPSTRVKPERIEHEEKRFDFALLDDAVQRAKQTAIDHVLDGAGEDLAVEELAEALPGHIVLDIRHPDQAEAAPLQLAGIEVKTLPFFALNSSFATLDPTRQYLLYCDKGMMSRLHAAHLLAEGHSNVRVYRP